MKNIFLLFFIIAGLVMRARKILEDTRVYSRDENSIRTYPIIHQNVQKVRATKEEKIVSR